MCMALHSNLPPFQQAAKGTTSRNGTPLGCPGGFCYAPMAKGFTANECTRISGSYDVAMFARLCTLCEWPLRELLNENANMGVQNNYFV